MESESKIMFSLRGFTDLSLTQAGLFCINHQSQRIPSHRFQGHRFQGLTIGFAQGVFGHLWLYDWLF